MESSDIKNIALVEFLKGKGLSQDEIDKKINETKIIKDVKKELRRLKNRELSRNYYRRKQAEKGLSVSIRV